MRDGAANKTAECRYTEPPSTPPPLPPKSISHKVPPPSSTSAVIASEARHSRRGEGFAGGGGGATSVRWRPASWASGGPGEPSNSAVNKPKVTRLPQASAPEGEKNPSRHSGTFCYSYSSSSSPSATYITFYSFNSLQTTPSRDPPLPSGPPPTAAPVLASRRRR